MPFWKWFIYWCQVPKRKSKKEKAQDAAAAAEAKPEENKKKKKKGGLFSFFRQSTENVLLEIKSTLIQIFNRPEQDSINKAILEELKQIRLQMKKCLRKTTGDEDGGTESDSDTSKPKAVMDAAVKPQTEPTNEQKPAETTTAPTPSPPKPAEEPPPAEEFNMDDDPDNPAWIRDPELGNGEVSRPTFRNPFKVELRFTQLLRKNNSVRPKLYMLEVGTTVQARGTDVTVVCARWVSEPLRTK